MSEERAVPADGAKGGDECSVCVAVHVRPLIDNEIVDGCQNCIFVDQQEQQVSIGTHTFRYDYVFGPTGLSPAGLYPKCVLPLVDALFKGYNATVFAYGQTGSGKTYTMGSAFQPGGLSQGVLPSVMDTIYARLREPGDIQYSIRAAFVEIHKEEIRDLLQLQHRGIRPSISVRETPGGGVCLAGATEMECTSLEDMAELLYKGSLCRATASTQMNNRSSRSHAIFSITLEQRKVAAGSLNVSMDSATEEEVEGEGDGEEEPDGEEDDYLCAKMHLVDLAGSERAKRTKAEGQRLLEAIQINKGLLALGNVISALVEKKAHVPYRNSKLTRLLQDSLGGNSRTVMVACVSPADSNMEESVNTLRYAANARKIRNKPVINRDPTAARIASLQQQLAAARAEVVALKKALSAKDGSAGDSRRAKAVASVLDSDDILSATLEHTQQQCADLQADKLKLKQQLALAFEELEEGTQRRVALEAERAKLQLKLRQLQKTTVPAFRNRTPLQQMQPPAEGRATATEHHELAQDQVEEGPELGRSSTPGDDSEVEGDVIQAQVQRIADLEREVRRLRRVQRLSGAYMSSAGCALKYAAGTPGTPGSVAAGSPSMPLAGRCTPSTPASAAGTPSTAGGRVLSSPQEACGQADDAAKLADGGLDMQEREHMMEQGKLSGMMQMVQQTLEQRQMQLERMRGGTGQVAVLKQHYDRVLKELQQERDALQKERSRLLQKFQDMRAHSTEDREAVESRYKAKMEKLEERVAALKQKEREFMRLERLKSLAEQSVKKLENDINRLRSQKVSIAKRASEQQRSFDEWKKRHNKDLAVARKEGARTRVEVQRLLALQEKQQAVLRRKTEEAEMARRKLQDMMSKKAHAHARRTQRHAAESGRRGRQAKDDALAVISSTAPDSCLLAAGVLPAAGRPEEAETPNEGGPMSPDSKRMLADSGSCRSWVEEELDRCNQSWQMRRVLDGELAHRSAVAHRLHETSKRLTVLLSQRESGAVVSNEELQSLEEVKQELAAKVAAHSTNIAKLQQDIEGAKETEAHEVAAASAHHAERWSGGCDKAQAALLYETLFRTAASFKAQSSEAQQEALELRDELEMTRLQLEAAREEAEAAVQQAMDAHHITASLMAADSARTEVEPSPDASSDNPLLGVEDSEEAELEGLLQELAEATGSSTPPRADGGAAAAGVEMSLQHYARRQCTGPDGLTEGVEAGAEAEVGGLRAEAMRPAKLSALLQPMPSSDVPEVEESESPPVLRPDNPNALDGLFRRSSDCGSLGGAGPDPSLRPASAGGVMQLEMLELQEPTVSRSPTLGRSPREGRDAEPNVGSQMAGWAAAQPEDEDEVATASVEAARAAPHGCAGARRSGGTRRAAAESLPPLDVGGGGSDQEGSDASAEDDADDDPTWQPAQEVEEEHSFGRSSKRKSTEMPAQPGHISTALQERLQAEMYERPVLRAINMARRESNRTEVQRLSRDLLQQHLKGKKIQGVEWRAGRKTRAEMVNDYRQWLGLPCGGLLSAAGSAAGGRRLSNASATAALPGIPLTSPTAESPSTPTGRGKASTAPLPRDAHDPYPTTLGPVAAPSAASLHDYAKSLVGHRAAIAKARFAAGQPGRGAARSPLEQLHPEKRPSGGTAHIPAVRSDTEAHRADQDMYPNPAAAHPLQQHRLTPSAPFASDPSMSKPAPSSNALSAAASPHSSGFQSRIEGELDVMSQQLSQLNPGRLS